MSESLEECLPRVYRFACRLTQDPEAAEDLTQETFLRAWQQRHRLRDPRAARVWLFTIAANLWRDQLRRGRSPVARAGPLTQDQPSTARTPDVKASQQEAVSRALEALGALPSRQREVLYLNACEGLAVAEIAAVLGLTSDAVKASLSLARKKLRQELGDLLA